MRSRVLRSPSLDTLVSRYSWKATPDYRAVDEKIYQVALKYKQYQTVMFVAAGDIVSLSMVSDAKKFNRKLKLQVGSNMFDRELETAVIGSGTGNSCTLSHSAGQITYTVESIQRLVVPPITDEMIQGLQMDGISTVAQLREHFITESLKQSLQAEVFDAMPIFLEHWEYSIDEQDLYDMDEHEMERCRGISRSMGEVFDELTEQQLLGAVGCHDIPEFRAMIHEYHHKTLRAALVEAALLGQDAAKLTVDDCNSYYGALMNRIVLCALQQMKENVPC